MVWIIVTLGFRKCPRARGGTDAANHRYQPLKIATAGGSRGGVPGRNKDTA
jgi:hypothetical protein